MLKHVTAGMRSTHPVRRTVACLAMMAMTVAAASSIVSAKGVYIINDGQTRMIVEASGYVPSAIVRNAGIEVSDLDRITSSRDENNNMEITITRSQDVTINYQDSSLHVHAYEETVEDLLERMDIDLGVRDEVSIDLGSYTTDGMVIDIQQYTFDNVEAMEPVTYTTERVANPSLTKGKEVVKQAGKNGTARITYYVTYKDGVEVEREPVSSELVTAPVNEIVEYGTKSANIAKSDRISKDTRNKDGSGVLTFKSGDTLTYSRVINGSATAYTAKPGALTASGKPVYVGGVAVDPRVIPLGSKLYLTTPDGRVVYGMATAIDTGGAIKGNIIDLFYNTYNECIQFGRRAMTIYVLN